MIIILELLLQRSSGIFPMLTEQIYWRTFECSTFLLVRIFFLYIFVRPFSRYCCCSGGFLFEEKRMFFNIFIACNFIGFYSYYYDYVADSVRVCVCVRVYICECCYFSLFLFLSFLVFLFLSFYHSHSQINCSNGIFIDLNQNIIRLCEKSVENHFSRHIFW